MILNVPHVNLSIFRFCSLCSLVKSSLSQVCSSHTWGVIRLFKKIAVSCLQLGLGICHSNIFATKQVPRLKLGLD